VQEGHSGFTPAVFVVSLSRASARTVTVRYATAPGTAQAGSDYSSVSGTVSFAPGATTAAVNVPVIGDRRCERDETFLLRLSDPVGGTLADAEGTGTIVNDDCGPRSR
jgi:chitinase